MTASTPLFDRVFGVFLSSTFTFFEAEAVGTAPVSEERLEGMMDTSIGSSLTERELKRTGREGEIRRDVLATEPGVEGTDPRRFNFLSRGAV